MANVTIDINKGVSKFFEDKFEKDIQMVTKLWSKAAAPTMRSKVIQTISSGNSPVKNFGRFQRYSEMYQEQISKGRYKSFGKKLRPINLKLSGKMHRSFISRDTKRGFSVYFTNPLAKIHNEEGAGKSKAIRRIMPIAGRNEQWKRIITKDISANLQRLAKKKFGKLT